MKKVITLFSICFVLIFAFISCDLFNMTTYSLEIGVVTNSTHDTANNMAASYGSNINFDNIKTIRDYLYENTTTGHDTSKGVSEDDLKAFLMEKSLSSAKANEILEGIDRIGSDIVYFNYAYSSSSKVWMYIVKD